MKNALLSEVVIRDASSEDTPGMLATIQQASIDAYAKLGISKRSLEAFVEDPEYKRSKLQHWQRCIVDRTVGQLAVAATNIGVIGYAESGLDESVPWLRALYIAPSWQGQGIGTALMRRALDPHLGAATYVCSTEGSAAIGFYESNGFKLTGRNAWTCPDDLRFMPERPLHYDFVLPQVELVRKAASIEP